MTVQLHRLYHVPHWAQIIDAIVPTVIRKLISLNDNYHYTRISCSKELYTSSQSTCTTPYHEGLAAHIFLDCSPTRNQRRKDARVSGRISGSCLASFGRRFFSEAPATKWRIVLLMLYTAYCRAGITHTLQFIPFLQIFVATTYLAAYERSPESYTRCTTHASAHSAALAWGWSIQTNLS